MTTALTTYGTQVAAASLTSAGKLATTTGGTGGTTTTAIGTATGYGELCALGTASAWPALGSLPAPTGKGWLLDNASLNSQAFLAGNWTATFKSKISAGTLSNVNCFVRAYAYDTSALTYTLIGTCELDTQSWSTAAANYNFSATALAEFIFNGTQRLYIDCWLNVGTNGSSGGSTITVNLASTGSTGVIGDMQMTTPGYNPALAFSCTVAGVGTLSGTPSAKTALSAECDGVGTLSATMNATTALSSTLAGVGTLSATGTYQAALSGGLAGVGTLIVTPSFTVALGGMLPGIGTLSGTFSAQAALLATLTGIGTLSGMPGYAVALLATLTGTGTFSGTLSCAVFLSGTFVGTGTFALVFVPVYWIAVWKTRDGIVSWKSRDGIALWKSRDEDVTWSI